MVNTKHGWHIPGTEVIEVYEYRNSCGGAINRCPECMYEVVKYFDSAMRSEAMANHPSAGKDGVKYSIEKKEGFSYLKSEEIRTTSETGGEKGVKPERYSLIPVEALDILARLYGFGAKKYSAHNWRKGYEWSKSYDSLQRHATAFWRGEDYDTETGLPHLAGVIFHAMTLTIFMDEQRQYDDRYIAPEIQKVTQDGS